MIIGITGTIGAGKGTVVEYLKETYGFAHFSVRAFLVEEVQRRGLEPTRPSFQLVANELRKEHGPGYIAETLYERAHAHNENAIVEALRATGEVDVLRAKGSFMLIAVDAEQRIRYERIRERNSSTDHVNFEDFVAIENKEMASQDPTKQNLKACMDMADIVLTNNGSKEELYAQVDVAMKRIMETA